MDDAIFVDSLETLGATQVQVVQVEELIIKHGIRVFVLKSNRHGVIEIGPEALSLIQAFRRLDVILIKRAA